MVIPVLRARARDGDKQVKRPHAPGCASAVTTRIPRYPRTLPWPTLMGSIPGLSSFAAKVVLQSQRGQPVVSADTYVSFQFTPYRGVKRET
jgi:hypothetical protein